MQSSPFKSGLFWVSLVVVGLSVWLWKDRQERHQQLALQTQQIQTQRAASLLFRAFHTDNYLTYSAISKTTAHMGDKKMETVARIVHAPRRLSISYQSGNFAGLSGGFNEHWTWRQAASSKPMIPYAELERPTDEMAATRFALMLENYKAQWEGREPVSGRTAEVIHLRPMNPVEGATGPARKLWIDAETGLTLRQQSYNHSMMKVMESVLSNVNFEPEITASTFVSPQRLHTAALSKPWTAHEIGNDRERAAKLSGLYPPEAKDLPNGFAFDNVGVHRCEACEGACYAVLSRYTDGMNTLTLFALKPQCLDGLQNIVGKSGKAAAGKDPNEEGFRSCEFGSGSLVMRDVPEGHLIALADLPIPALQRVLESTSVRVHPASR